MKIPFGDSQHNDYLKLNDHIAILHSPVSDETFFVYKNDILYWSVKSLRI